MRGEKERLQLGGDRLVSDAGSDALDKAQEQSLAPSRRFERVLGWLVRHNSPKLQQFN